MTYGTALVIGAIGAILRYAVSDTVEGIDLAVVGLILMIVGAIGLVASFVHTLSHRRMYEDRRPLY